MTEVSRAARAVLAAVTWKRYDVPPEGLPNFALEIAPLLAIALRTAVDKVLPDDALYARTCCEFVGENARTTLLAVAAELDDVTTLTAELESLSDAN